jgi:hypothetical protein
VAFVYVFLIGRRLSGAVCGTVALIVLFAHQPLLFAHGLRSNNMEAALFLAYCGGIYHYLALASATGRRRAVHIGAIGAWFVLGFMTKFVAALFLPVILGAAIVLLPAHRRALAADWRRWLFTAMIGAAVILPWFVYQHLREGEALWQVMFGDHVYTRFTEYTDPSHLQPWHFYISEVWRQFVQSRSAIWVAFGLIVLAVQTARRRLAEGSSSCCGW